MLVSYIYIYILLYFTTSCFKNLWLLIVMFSNLRIFRPICLEKERKKRNKISSFSPQNNGYN